MEAQLTSRDLRGSGLIAWIKFQRRSPACDADEPRQLSTIEPVAPINDLDALNVIPEFLLQNQCFSLEDARKNKKPTRIEIRVGRRSRSKKRSSVSCAAVVCRTGDSVAGTLTTAVIAHLALLELAGVRAVAFLLFALEVAALCHRSF